MTAVYACQLSKMDGLEDCNLEKKLPPTGTQAVSVGSSAARTVVLEVPVFACCFLSQFFTRYWLSRRPCLTLGIAEALHKRYDSNYVETK